MLSKKSKYGIRAVLYLCLHSHQNMSPIGGKQISESLKMPLAFTVKILQELAKKNIISSAKGPGGGFYLSKMNCQSTLMDLLKVFGDDDYFTCCAIGLPDCSDERPCPIHESVKKSREEMKIVFEKKTISELRVDIENDALFLVL